MWNSVDFYSSLPHYREHLEPVWDALPASLRGGWYGPSGSSRTSVSHATARWPRDRLVVVASYVDGIRVGPRPFVYVEHGAGQSYGGDPASVRVVGHSGAPGLDRCVLFLCPNESVAARWRHVYEHTATAVIGCPRLDRHHARLASASRDGGPMVGDSYSAGSSLPTVAFTFHWDCGLLPETRSAWNFYAPRLPEILADAPWRIIAHSHPREWPLLERRWRKVPQASVTRSVDTVLADADVLVADNTSAMWEFASLGKPLVILDAPWYRHDVEHGLRFWKHADAGVRIADPSELRDAVTEALADPADIAARRAAAVFDVYSGLDDGYAAGRAAAAITAIMEKDESGQPKSASDQPGQDRD